MRQTTDSQSLDSKSQSKSQPWIFISAILSLIATVTVTIAWVHFVQRLVSTASASEGEQHWITKANQSYNLCYKGCADCLYVDIIDQACQKTFVTVPNTICSASKIWFWADRYPQACLLAIGEIYKAEALSQTRFYLKFWYILTPVFIILTFCSSFILLSSCAPPSRSSPTTRHPKTCRSDPSLGPLLAVVAISSVPTTAQAFSFPCINQFPAHSRPFTNTNNTLFGLIHGYRSSCSIYTYACGETCTTSSADHHVSCSTKWCEDFNVDKGPIHFVEDATELVEKCGFKMVDYVPGVVGQRIPNPGIEEKLWVTVSVSRFNGSEGLEDTVRCLYDMVD